MNTLAQRACHAIVAFGCTAAFLATPATDAQSARWVATGPLNVPRYAHTATLLADGNVLVVGGSGPDGALASAERYDPVTGKWRVVASPAVARNHLTATLLFDGNVLVVGGSERPEIYDPVADTWSMTAGTVEPHFSHTATRLASGKVLVVGGTGDFSVPSVPFTAELYDPATGQWAAAGNPRWARIQHTATLLVNGTVLVAGGISNNDYEDGELPDPQNAEIYDPATNSWREVGMPLRTDGHTATLLANGKVLVVGGTGFLIAGPAQLFDTTSETWRDLGPLNAERLNHTATLLSSGKVLLAGSGALRGTGVSTAVETYDPATERFASTASLGVGRQSHTATLLANGNVLVAGGMGHAGDGFAVRGTAELHVPPFEIGAGMSGAWYDPAQSGHGLFIEVLRDNRLLAGWFAFNPVGTAQAWFVGVGTYSGDTATITSVDMPTGGTWIPNFDPSSVVHNAWGALTLRFTDCNHGTVSFNSPSFGVGTMSLTRLTQPLGSSCP
ncbi:MAG TPA: kelch repeat-containing protein [Burkholderiales bacterium]|nr:kelch repeat-containing protein [Burkholderiales bacterium]